MEMLQAGNLQQMFSLPLSELAFQEINQLSSMLGEISLDNEGKDTWAWRHRKKSEYSAKKIYDSVHQPVLANPILSGVWKSCCTMTIKMFAWLVIMDRFNTKDMI